MRRSEPGSGSGSGTGSQDRPTLTEDRVREIICEEVVEIVRGQIPEMFGSIKTAMMEYFDDIYAALAETAAATATSAVTATATITATGGGASRVSSTGTSIARSPQPSMGLRIRS